MLLEQGIHIWGWFGLYIVAMVVVAIGLGVWLKSGEG